MIYLLRQVCAALSEAHSLGLIHRDLKPSNIFVARRGGESDVAKVLDFGLVKLTRDPVAAALTQDLTVSGTPAYMAPEQATAAADLDARADLYSLGAVAYFALTGRPPFAGDSAFSILMAHARDPVVPPSQIRADVPPDLESVVLTCLAKSPSARYPDARTLGPRPRRLLFGPRLGFRPRRLLVGRRRARGPGRGRGDDLIVGPGIQKGDIRIQKGDILEWH